MGSRLPLLLILLLTACSRPAYDALTDEDRADDLTPLKHRFTNAARSVRQYTTSISGRPCVIIESATPTPTPPTPPTTDNPSDVPSDAPSDSRAFILIHGAFADSRCWRFLGGDLLAAGSLLMVDLPGCGRSDKPDPDDGADYSPHALASAAAEALSQHLASLPSPPDRLTLVGHSLGGSILLELLGAPDLRARFAPLLARVDSLVLMAPVDRATELPLAAVSPKVRSAVETSGIVIDLAHVVGVLRERVSEGSLEAVHDPKHALREEADERIGMLTDTTQRVAMRAMLLAALPPRRGPAGESPDWDWIAKERDKQRSIELPTLIIWGERDESLPPSMGFRLAATLPHARLLIVDRTMHSPYIERPDEVGAAIRRFVADPFTQSLDPNRLP